MDLAIGDNHIDDGTGSVWVYGVWGCYDLSIKVLRSTNHSQVPHSLPKVNTLVLVLPGESLRKAKCVRFPSLYGWISKGFPAIND